MSSRSLAYFLACGALLAASGAHGQVRDIPDHASMPGLVYGEVTQENIDQTVCVPGWTAELRETHPYRRNLKRDQMEQLGQPGPASDYREDHIVPLCAGGHPNDARNLWPQPLRGQWNDNGKNQLERSVCRLLCRGEITLEAAQAIFLAPDWRIEYERFFTNSQ